jgi:hypothetical protein
MTIKVTERGWPSHFILGDRCLFRRNTLIEGPNDSVIVGTVGSMMKKDGTGIDTIGPRRYYETMVFGAVLYDHHMDADVSDQRSFESPWAITADSPDELGDDVDNIANDMHEAVVAEFVQKLEPKG